MNIPTKRLKTGFEIPVLGFGTWKIGGDRVRNTTNDKEDISAIQRAIDKGITHIDTAEIYAQGHAEELIGIAIKNHDRSKLFITSKVKPENLSFDNVLKSIKESLKRLQTDYLDLYLIHAPNPEIPLIETMKAMDQLIDQGLVKNIGVSNFNIQRFEKAQSYSKNKIVCNQVHYNLIFREPERKEVTDYCQKNDVMIVAFRPVERGLLAEKDNPLMEEICKKYNRTPSQIAINWLISQPNVIAISKMADKKHLEENLGGIDWKMKEEDIEKLRIKFPDQKDISDVNPLI